MKPKRIIPCLDVINGRVVKGEQFKHLKDVADPIDLATHYEKSGADDLIVYDITATTEGRTIFLEMIEAIARVISMPLTVGGGLRTLEDIEAVLQAGAQKVSINSSAINNPIFLKEASNMFGSERIVLAIDAKQINNETWHAFTSGGSKDSGLNVYTWARQAEAYGVGEIILNCMDSDGVKDGYNLELNRIIADAVNIPVIASGGAGELHHFASVFQETNVQGALAASIFHSEYVRVSDVKQFLKEQNIPIREFLT